MNKIYIQQYENLDLSQPVRKPACPLSSPLLNMDQRVPKSIKPSSIHPIPGDYLLGLGIIIHVQWICADNN